MDNVTIILDSDQEELFPDKSRHYWTTDDWSEVIEEETRGKKANFRFLSREVFSSKAYIALTLPQREILLCYLNKVQYDKAPANNRRMKHSRAYPKNGNQLMVTNNEIKARGIVGPNNNKTIAEARKALVEIGFLDVVQSGSYRGSGIFALSNRWRKYPDGDYLPKDSKPVAWTPYNNIHENYNVKRITKVTVLMECAVS